MKSLLILFLSASLLIQGLPGAWADSSTINPNYLHSLLKNMSQKLVDQQKPDGRFEGPFETDPGLELLSLVLLRKYEKPDLAIEKQFIDKAMKWKSGPGFGSYPRGPYNHDVTGLVLLSLESMGYDLNTYKIKYLKKKFEMNGGIEKLNIGTKILLAPLGLSSAGAIELLLEPALLNVPSYLPISSKKLGIFRSLIIPLVSWNYFRKLPAGSHIASQTAKDGIKWILDHQMSNGTWYTLFHAIVNLGALSEAQRVGNGNYRPQIKKAIAALKNWRVTNFDGELTQQLTLTTGWDTPQSLLALSELPKDIKDNFNDEANNAVEFLDRNQIVVQGDWSVNSPHLQPGGWSFIVENTDYPDTDVVAAVLEGKLAFQDKSSPYTFYKGLNWLLGLQNDDGGFPAWEKGISITGDKIIKILFAQLPDYSDLSQADVTSRISRLTYKLIKDPQTPRLQRESLQNSFQKSCKFIHQSSIDGIHWKGRWLVAFLYGTSEVLDTLASTSCGKLHNLNRTVKWLVEKQNKDGGFGEDHRSFIENKFVPGKSTLMQTSYVVQGLIAYEERYNKEHGTFSPYIGHLDHAIVYLMEQAKNKDGFVTEGSFTGVIGAKLWYANYSLSPQFMTLRALGRFHHLISKGL